MRPRRAEAAVMAVIFVAAALWGTAAYKRFLATGGHPFFYQTYFEPAVMLACGKGFLIGPSPSPALRAFLFQESDRFSCEQLPANIQLGTQGLYQRPWRYLLTAVAVAWMVLGISWSGLGPLFGVLFGATTTLAYILTRQLTGRAAAVTCAAAMAVSPVQLANLPNLRDYAKAPFALALLAILVALARRPLAVRGVLVLSAVYGLVMGIGYGFRTDLLIDLPAFLIVIALFLPGGVLNHLGLKAAAVAVFAVAFAAAAWPIIAAVTTGGGCQWHVFLLGMSDPFNDALGVQGGSYSWGHLYKDEYLWAAVAAYANRFRPDLGYVEYCSRAYDTASGEYLGRILLTFPADMVTRAYASALHILELPFARLPQLALVGPISAAVGIVGLGLTQFRLAVFALFVVLFFGGHPAIQFLPRHYFPFEAVAWTALALVADRAVTLARGSGRSLRVPRDAASLREAAVTAAALVGILVVPLLLLRTYQNRQVSTLLQSYASAAASPLAAEAIAPGRYRVESGPEPSPRTESAAVEALGRGAIRFVAVSIPAGACRPDTTVTFRYANDIRATDFSWTVKLESAAGADAATTILEPVYAGFRGIELSDPSPACAPNLSLVNDVNQLPLVLPAQLTPDWKARPQFQRIVRLR